MSSALEALRAQREVVDHIHARVKETGERLGAIQTQTDRIASDPALRDLLRDEQRWLHEMRQTIAEVRAFREHELRRFWPGVWRRWAVAMVLALVTAFAASAGYVWTVRPYETEMTDLRRRAELGDSVARRVLTMTPAERRQFDALMKSTIAR